MPYEAVNHPKHYNEHPAGIECIDVVEHMSFNVGSAVKYLWRAGLKPGTNATQDLQKAAWYVAREIERLAVLAPEQPYEPSQADRAFVARHGGKAS